MERFEEMMLERNRATVFSDHAHRESLHKHILSKINDFQSSKKIKRCKKLAGIAASITLLVSLGLSSIYFNNDTRVVFENNSNDPKEIILNDESIITLNHHSKLIHNKKFDDDNRFVELEGEAFFEVEKNKSIPFIIKTKTIFTKVVGTKFNINSNDDFINVSVNEGHVKVYDDQNKLDATANQQIKHTFENKKLSESSIRSEIYNLWTKDEFTLDNISIDELSIVFQSIIYRHQIVFKDENVRNKEISISFDRSENINAVLDKINLINEFKLTKKQNNMIEAY